MVLDKVREWDPQWAEACSKMSTNPWTSGILPLKLVELISVAINAACTNLNPEAHPPPYSCRARGRRNDGGDHGGIEALRAQGVQACNLGVPILAEEMAKPTGRGNLKAKK